MTDDELAAIEARFARRQTQWYECDNCREDYNPSIDLCVDHDPDTVAADIPVLIAEVRRLRAAMPRCEQCSEPLTPHLYRVDHKIVCASCYGAHIQSFVRYMVNVHQRLCDGDGAPGGGAGCDLSGI